MAFAEHSANAFVCANHWQHCHDCLVTAISVSLSPVANAAIAAKDSLQQLLLKRMLPHFRFIDFNSQASHRSPSSPLGS